MFDHVPLVSIKRIAIAMTINFLDCRFYLLFLFSVSFECISCYCNYTLRHLNVSVVPSVGQFTRFTIEWKLIHFRIIIVSPFAISFALTGISCLSNSILLSFMRFMLHLNSENLYSSWMVCSTLKLEFSFFDFKKYNLCTIQQKTQLKPLHFGVSVNSDIRRMSFVIRRINTQFKMFLDDL